MGKRETWPCQGNPADLAKISSPAKSQMDKMWETHSPGYLFVKVNFLGRPENKNKLLLVLL
jgi:hypothetical protein